MRRPVTVVLILLAAFILLGLGLTYLSRSRDAANHAGCRNNLRILSLLGAKDAKPLAVWSGTVPNEKLRPEERLSWVVLALPTLADPKAADAAKGIDATAAWNAAPNQVTAAVTLRTLICPAFVPTRAAGESALTMYVGIAGLGADAATLPLADPLSPRTGAFRYDAPTPIELIRKNDGISQTLLFGQTLRDLGPWIRGGPSTVRGLDAATPILAREGGQFGGTFADGAYFSFVDGSVRLFRYSTDPVVLKHLATIAGGPITWD